MTALLYLLEKNKVCIAMDSLSIDGQTKEPFKFVTKIFLLPHLKGVICGTGSLDIILDWHFYIQKNVLATDILFLDEIATEKLCEISENCDSNCDLATTVYHFGYNERSSEFIGFAYRGANSFESEELIYGIGIKPFDGKLEKIDLEELQQKGLPVGFIELMQKQKEYDDNLPKSKKIGIGGEIHFLYLDKNQTLLAVCHRFDDYNEALQKMFQHPSISTQ